MYPVTFSILQSIAYISIDEVLQKRRRARSSLRLFWAMSEALSN